MGKRPGQNTGNEGGIYQEQGPRGGLRDNYTTVPEHRPLPPTSKPNSTWVPVKRTPHGHHK
ncbi:hypothetical protein SAMN05414139_04533 [Burkholderia sp. D7]|nr:hypothetical protein SAMN05414139_04533 [Burkholderia sp. D7]